MTRKAMLSKLEKHGYSVTFPMLGGVIAKKHQRTYVAKTLTGLLRHLFNQ